VTTSTGPGRPRGSLFRRYTLHLALLLSLLAAVSGCIGAWFAYRDARALVDELQREKARSAAARIGQFIQAVELQLRGAVVSGRAAAARSRSAPHRAAQTAAHRACDQRRKPRWTRPVTNVSGCRGLRVTWWAAASIAATDPLLIAAREGRTGYGGISFRRQSEPHLAIAVSGTRPDDGAIVADINLKFASTLGGRHPDR